MIEQGHSVDEASERLSLPKSTLANWVKAFKFGKLDSIGKHYKEKSETELEIARLKRELAKVKMERDILKKAAAYLCPLGASQKNLNEVRADH